MALGLKIGRCSLQGVREHNEDAVLVTQTPEAIICLLADGAGGGAAGRLASRRGADVVSRELCRRLRSGADSALVVQWIEESYLQANTQLLAYQSLEPGLRPMSTSLALFLWQHGSDVVISGVGNSSIYRVRHAQIDLAYLDRHVRDVLDHFEALRQQGFNPSFGSGNQFSPLGRPNFSFQVEVLTQRLQPGNRYLMCTDGLADIVDDHHKLRYLRTEIDVQRCAERLCQQALDNGSRDNVSCIVVEVVENPSPSTPVAVKMANVSKMTTSEGQVP